MTSDDSANRPSGSQVLANLKNIGTTQPYVAVHIQNGVNLIPQNVNDLNIGWFNPLREAGVSLVLWAFLGPPDGSVDPFPEDEARLLAQQVSHYNAAAVIVCAEESHKAPGAVESKVSSRFASTFRSLQPALPAAIQTFAAPSGDFTFPFDLWAWTTSQFVVMPECYWGTMSGASPDYEPQRAFKYLSSPSRDHRPQVVPYFVKPTFAAYGYGGSLNHTPSEYIDNVKALSGKMSGFNIYDLEQMSTDEWAVWGSAVKIGLAK